MAKKKRNRGKQNPNPEPQGKSQKFRIISSKVLAERSNLVLKGLEVIGFLLWIYTVWHGSYLIALWLAILLLIGIAYFAFGPTRVFVLVGCLLIVVGLIVQPRLPLPETEYEGWLVPDNEPFPFEPHCPFASSDTVYVFFGSGLVAYTLPNFEDFTPVRIRGHDLISLHRGAGGVMVSGEIFDQDGIVAEIHEGRFKVFRGDFIKHEHPNEHRLITYDRWNNKQLDITYLNPHAIKILGSFFFPGSFRVIVSEEQAIIGNDIYSDGSCLTAGVAGIVVQ